MARYINDKNLIHLIFNEEGMDLILSWVRGYEPDAQLEDGYLITCPVYNVDGLKMTGYKTNIVGFHKDQIYLNPFSVREVAWRKKKRSKWLDLSDYSSDKESDDWGSVDLGYFHPMEREMYYKEGENITSKLYDFILEVPSILRNDQIDRILK